MEAALSVRTQWCSPHRQLASGQKYGRHKCMRVHRMAPVRALFGRKPQQGSQKACPTCKSKGSVPCPGCKGTGRNKSNGNVFERYKCYDCQGFGMITCPKCGKGGLTPEQRGER